MEDGGWWKELERKERCSGFVTQQYVVKLIPETSGMQQGRGLFERQPNEETGGQASNPSF